VRPGAIEVDNEPLAAVLRPACEAIGVPVRVSSKLETAYAALADLESHFAGRAG